MHQTPLLAAGMAGLLMHPTGPIGLKKTVCQGARASGHQVL
jgi:hypothetical protein